MPQVYGKKSRVILQKDFFNGTPEPRRSPRLRKVLVEQSSNVQRLDSSPPTLSPCAQKSRPIRSRQPQQDSIYEDEDEDEEPVKQPPRRQEARKNTNNGQEEDETEALAKALGLLDLEELRELNSSSKQPKVDSSNSQSPSISSSASSISSSPSRSTSTQKTQQAVSIPQHPAKLKPETLTYIAPLLQCKNFSQTVESFSGWVTARQSLLTFTKIGEGSYGQVFRATDSSGATVIIKLMPLNAARGRRWQTFTSVDAAATEVKLLAKMQKVPGFVEYRGGCVLQGSMPEPFMVLWDEYRDAGRTLESQDPRITGTYPSTQLWLMLEMSDAGTNLEPGHYLPLEALEECLSDRRGKQASSKRAQKKKTWADKGKYLAINRVWDIFWQVVFAVAKAEAYCRFEHRDLHLGNICVKDDNQTQTQSPSGHSLINRKSSLPMPVTATGTTITIIDYTLSRADASSTSAPAMAFDFQSDACLLSGQGDLQYDMYRWMDEVIGDRGCGTYDPRTNVVWFYHLLVKLLDMAIPLAGNSGGDKSNKREAVAESVDAACADDDDDDDDDDNEGEGSEEEDLGEDSELFRSETAEQAMLRVLQEVRGLTDPAVIRTWVANSAGDLLKHAFAKDWLVADGV